MAERPVRQLTADLGDRKAGTVRLWDSEAVGSEAGGQDFEIKLGIVRAAKKC